MRDFKLIIKRIGKPLLFLLILIIIFLFLSRQMILATRKDDSLIPSRNKSIVNIQKERKNSLDLIFLGDSESYCSFSPMQMWKDMGIASFVCGQSGQRIQEAYYMLKTVLDHQSPKVVVLETNIIFREQKGLDGLKETLAEKGNYYLPILRFHDVWKTALMGKGYSEECYKGFVLRDLVKPYDDGEYMIETTDKEEVSSGVNEYMNNIVLLCKKKNIKLSLISVPSPVNYDYEKHNAIQEFADKNSLDYIDLNLLTDDIDIDWETDTIDQGDHLNLAGAQKVTSYVEGYLQSKYNFKDHRNDDDYKKWSEEELEYEEIADEKLENIRRRQ